MRIGELAAMLGVSTRTVRHYHHQGVLPEPSRRANGYREYGMRDAISLARVRRLVELGLSLDEVRDVVADDRDRQLSEILLEIDADLAQQEQEIRVRRSRLAELLEQAGAGKLGPDDTASPELVAFLRRVEIPSSKSAAWDRDLLMLIDTMAAPSDRERAAAMYAPLASDPASVAHSHDFYRRLDDLAEAEPDDPRVTPLATALAEYAAEHMLAEHTPDTAGWRPEMIEPLIADLAPAQAEVVRQTVRLIAGRAR